jgi:hypothetical protein
VRGLTQCRDRDVVERQGVPALAVLGSETWRDAISRRLNEYAMILPWISSSSVI